MIEGLLFEGGSTFITYKKANSIVKGIEVLHKETNHIFI